MSDKLTGVIAAVATAVDETGAPDAARSTKLARFLLDTGCDGLNVLGTTGEATSFSLEQRKAVIAAKWCEPNFYERTGKSQVSELEREEAGCRKNVSELGPRADELEALLLERATRFCTPLRSHRELTPLFQALESDAQG